VWVFNVWGTLDLLNAVSRGLLYTPDGALGATVWIPSILAPLLLVTHAAIFRLSVLVMRAEGAGHGAAGV